MIDLATVSAQLERARLDGWLIYDFRGSNPVFSHVLGQRLSFTRRAFLLATRSAEARLIVSRLDAGAVSPVPGLSLDTYTTWRDLHEWLATHVGPLASVAMEYSPHGELPAMSWVDGGTLDLVRGLGVEVMPSADLFQLTAASWGEAGLQSHYAAMEHLVAIKDRAFAFAQERLSAGGRCTEVEVQSLIANEFERRQLITDDPPLVAVNAHSADPHYEPSDATSSEFGRGDWMLIDLWAKEQVDSAVFADITWVGYGGPTVPRKHQEVFDIVASARDAVVASLRRRWRESPPIQGYELDRVARKCIASAGYGNAFVHRTGHSLGPGESVHGLGVNLDDLETHDTRPIRKGLGFTVEPGIYLPEFGVRSEINVYMDEAGPVVTSPVQTMPVVMDI
jgi:Xaa-Pro dipeptidase